MNKKYISDKFFALKRQGFVTLQKMSIDLRRLDGGGHEIITFS
jgi:hypothetical protein